jgi:N-acyl homoserine lactone hydrolase
MAVRKKETRHPITRVSWSAPGTVSIHPDTWHRPGSDLPVAGNLTHWTKPLPINAYVIEHRDGIVLFDTGQDRASVTDPGHFPGGAT